MRAKNGILTVRAAGFAKGSCLLWCAIALKSDEKGWGELADPESPPFLQSVWEKKTWLDSAIPPPLGEPTCIQKARARSNSHHRLDCVSSCWCCSWLWICASVIRISQPSNRIKLPPAVVVRVAGEHLSAGCFLFSARCCRCCLDCIGFAFAVVDERNIQNQLSPPFLPTQSKRRDQFDFGEEHSTSKRKGRAYSFFGFGRCSHHLQEAAAATHRTHPSLSIKPFFIFAHTHFSFL